MKPEDVPEEWFIAAWRAMDPTAHPETEIVAADLDIKIALAAVAPMIRRAALEKVAGEFERRAAAQEWPVLNNYQPRYRIPEFWERLARDVRALAANPSPDKEPGDRSDAAADQQTDDQRDNR